MKEIPLTRGKVALVDDEDFDRLNAFKWQASSRYGTTFYAVRYARIAGKDRQKKMHREILGLTDPRIHVDHKDRDGLNNTRANLRQANCSQNARNRGPKPGSTSRFLGVCWSKKSQKWQAGISVNKKQIHIGIFSSEIEAATARDVAARKYHGEFAALNSV